MKLFGQLIRTAVNVATLPVAVVQDMVTLGGCCNKGEFDPYTAKALEKLKEEAQEDE